MFNMITHKDYSVKINELFEKLNQDSLLVPFTDDSTIDKISERNNSIMHISEMKYMILTDVDLFKKYKNFWIPFDVSEFDLYNDYIQQGATYILGLFEMLRRFLLMFLDLKKLKLNEKSSLGKITFSISKKSNFRKKELEDLFMLEIRNIIAHDSWYYEGKNFCYKAKGIVNKLDLDEFVQTIVDVTDFTTSIAIHWWQYVPKLEFERIKKKMS